MATATFSISGSFTALVASRALQGAAGGLLWGAGLAWLARSSPAARLAAALGTAFAAATAGSLLGPVLGSLAAAAGARPVFGTVGLVAVALALASHLVGSPAASPEGLGPLRRLGARRVLLGAWLVFLYGGLVGAYTVLVALHLAGLGSSAFGVGAIFALAAAGGVLANPIAGRISDGHGRLGPVRASLALSAPLLAAQPWTTSPLLLGALVILASATLAPLWPLGAVILTEGSERGGAAWGDRSVHLALGTACRTPKPARPRYETSRTWSSPRRRARSPSSAPESIAAAARVICTDTIPSSLQ